MYMERVGLCDFGPRMTRDQNDNLLSCCRMLWASKENFNIYASW